MTTHEDISKQIDELKANMDGLKHQYLEQDKRVAVLETKTDIMDHKLDKVAEVIEQNSKTATDVKLTVVEMKGEIQGSQKQTNKNLGYIAVVIPVAVILVEVVAKALQG